MQSLWRMHAWCGTMDGVSAESDRVHQSRFGFQLSRRMRLTHEGHTASMGTAGRLQHWLLLPPLLHALP